jgi:hypothetical protein
MLKAQRTYISPLELKTLVTRVLTTTSNKPSVNNPKIWKEIAGEMAGGQSIMSRSNAKQCLEEAMQDRQISSPNKDLEYFDIEFSGQPVLHELGR